MRFKNRVCHTVHSGMKMREAGNLTPSFFSSTSVLLCYVNEIISYLVDLRQLIFFQAQRITPSI